MRSGDLLGLQIEMKATQFVNKLSFTDRSNLTRLTGSLTRTLLEQGLHGAIIGVGGVLTKPAPRKDIDYVIMLHMKRNPSDTQYDRLVTTMKILSDSARKMENESNGFFNIITINDPVMDMEYGVMGLASRDGDIQIKPIEGTIINLIPCNALNLEEFKKVESKPYAVLKTF